MSKCLDDLAESFHPVAPEKLDAAFVIGRLEEAGATLLSLPQGGHSTRIRLGQLDVVKCAVESLGWRGNAVRPPIPSAARISRMDQAFGWISLIPDGRYILRRIVGARALVSPVTDRHLYSWRRLGTVLGADHKAVQRCHEVGVDIIVAALVAQAKDGKCPT